MLTLVPQKPAPIIRRERISLTNQTIRGTLPPMLDPHVRRMLEAYPTIFLACHRQHVQSDEAGNKLTEHQASVLDHLDATRPTTLSKLAEHMGTGKSAMSIAIKRLVRGGYVRRSRVGGDARSVSLTLTSRGARVKEHNTVLDPGLLREMFRRMPPSELERSLAGLETFAKYAQIMLRQRKRTRDR